MASARDRAREARVERLAQEIAGLVGRGMSYQRARRDILAREPDLAHPSSRVLEEAETRTKNRRRIEAGQQRSRDVRQANMYLRTIQRIEQTPVQPEYRGTLPYTYEARQWFGVEPSRVQVSFINPITGQLQREVIYLPLYPGMSNTQIALAVMGAIAFRDRINDYNTKRLTYENIWDAMRHGNMVITR